MWDRVCTHAANLWIFRSFQQRYVRKDKYTQQDWYGLNYSNDPIGCANNALNFICGIYMTSFNSSANARYNLYSLGTLPNSMVSKLYHTGVCIRNRGDPYDVCFQLNPLVTNGLSHHYHLDESTFGFRGIMSKFLI